MRLSKNLNMLANPNESIRVQEQLVARVLFTVARVSDFDVARVWVDFSPRMRDDLLERERYVSS